MTNQQTFLTKDGLKKVKDELDELKNVKRKEIAWRIQEAKELGDLSENAEYTEAKNEQAFIEGRIAELELILKQATIIEEKSNSDVVTIGSAIKVEAEDGTTQTYTIVGSNESDPAQGKISNESPLGRAFIGHLVNETVIVEAPKGSAHLKSIQIQ